MFVNNWQYVTIINFMNLFPVHVRIAESPHEGIRTDHLLDPNPNTELGVAISKLVHIDADDTCVIVKFNKTLLISKKAFHQ